MCVSPNKGFNLGGLKSSYIIVKNKQIRERLLAYLQKVYVTSPANVDISHVACSSSPLHGCIMMIQRNGWIS